MLISTDPTNPVNFFGSDDLILDTFSAIDLGAGNGGFSGSNTYDQGSLVAGQELAIYWFYGVSQGDVISSGDSFGFFRTDIVDAASGADASFNVPAGGGVNIAAGAEELFMTGTQFVRDDFIASNGIVVPEPNGVLLLGLGVLLMVGRRSRRS